MCGLLVGRYSHRTVGRVGRRVRTVLGLTTVSVIPNRCITEVGNSSRLSCRPTPNSLLNMTRPSASLMLPAQPLPAICTPPENSSAARRRTASWTRPGSASSQSCFSPRQCAPPSCCGDERSGAELCMQASALSHMRRSHRCSHRAPDSRDLGGRSHIPSCCCDVINVTCASSSRFAILGPNSPQSRPPQSANFGAVSSQPCSCTPPSLGLRLSQTRGAGSEQ